MAESEPRGCLEPEKQGNRSGNRSGLLGAQQGGDGNKTKRERGRRTCRSAGGAQGPPRSVAALQGGGSPWQVVPEQSPVGGSLVAVCGETA